MTNIPANLVFEFGERNRRRQVEIAGSIRRQPDGQISAAYLRSQYAQKLGNSGKHRQLKGLASQGTIYQADCWLDGNPGDVHA